MMRPTGTTCACWKSPVTPHWPASSHAAYQTTSKHDTQRRGAQRQVRGTPQAGAQGVHGSLPTRTTMPQMRAAHSCGAGGRPGAHRQRCRLHRFRTSKVQPVTRRCPWCRCNERKKGGATNLTRMVERPAHKHTRGRRGRGVPSRRKSGAHFHLRSICYPSPCGEPTSLSDIAGR
jgi:hypothetical protein